MTSGKPAAVSAARGDRPASVTSSSSAGLPLTAAASRAGVGLGPVDDGEQRRAGRNCGGLQRHRQPVRVAGHPRAPRRPGRVASTGPSRAGQVGGVGEHQHGQPPAAQPVGELGHHPQRRVRAAGVAARVREGGEGGPPGAVQRSREPVVELPDERQLAQDGVGGHADVLPYGRSGRNGDADAAAGLGAVPLLLPVEVQPADPRAGLERRSSSRSAGMSQTTSNSRPSGSLPYRLLVVPWSDAPTSAPASPSASRTRLSSSRVSTSQARWYRPTVVRPAWVAGGRADLEQAEVVVVGRAGRLEEGGAAGRPASSPPVKPSTSL